MANLLSMVDLRNKPSREGFDLGLTHSFTTKVGELLPVCVREVFPGDKFKLNTDSFVRTQPCQTSAFVKLREYYDVIFVPLVQLWRFAPDVLAQADNLSFAKSPSTALVPSTEFPHFSVTALKGYCNGAGDSNVDKFGYSDKYKIARLFQMFRYGNSDYLTLSNSGAGYNHAPDERCIFRFAAYQKAYNDWFRFEQWQKPEPWTWNFDYLTDSTVIPNINAGNAGMFTLRRANWEKDYFLGLLPEAQFGAEAGVDVEFINDVSGANHTDLSAADLLTKDDQFTFINNKGASFPSGSGAQSQGFSMAFSSRDTPTKLRANLPIIALRQAQFLQKWKEIKQSGKPNYQDQIEKVFGVKPSSSYSGLSKYLYGWSNDISISEVMNTNLGESNSAIIKGKGIGSGNSQTEEFDFNEHGILLVLHHIKPQLQYQNIGADIATTRIDVEDWPNPVFDKIGMQPVNFFEMISSGSTQTSATSPNYMGYAPRYVDLKTSYDIVSGDFLKSSKDWVAPLTEEWLAKVINSDLSKGILNADVFRIDPSVLDSIFGVNAGNSVESDQFKVRTKITFGAVRNFDKNGLPY